MAIVRSDKLYGSDAARLAARKVCDYLARYISGLGKVYVYTLGSEQIELRSHFSRASRHVFGWSKAIAIPRSDTRQYLDGEASYLLDIALSGRWGDLHLDAEPPQPAGGSVVRRWAVGIVFGIVTPVGLWVGALNLEVLKGGAFKSAVQPLIALSAIWMAVTLFNFLGSEKTKEALASAKELVSFYRDLPK